MTVNKRLLFGSLAVAATVVVAIAVVAATRGDANTISDNVTLTSANDLSPTIGTNAAVTGRSFPKVDIETLAGDSFHTADLVGTPLVVNFWYSTCAPCKRNCPPSRPCTPSSVTRCDSSGSTRCHHRRTRRPSPVTRACKYELLYDPNGALTTAVGIANSPQTLFIDASGKIVEQTGELTADKLEALVRTKLL